MKKILLMRHAKSSWKDHTLDDFERPLAKRGRNDIAGMAQWVKTEGIIPDRVIASPARRTHETACGMLYALQSPDTSLREDKRLYLGNTRTHLEILERELSSATTVMLVGHNPALDHLLEYLCKEKPRCNSNGKLMTTGSIALLELAENTSRLDARCCRLVRLQRPGSLD